MMPAMSDENPVAAATTPPPAPSGTPSKDECNMAMLMYILALLTGWLAPLIIWLVKKDQSPFINDQGKELLNFQITVFFAAIISWLLIFLFFIGCVLMPIVIIGSWVLTIMGAIAVSKGTAYRFPFAIRLIK